MTREQALKIIDSSDIIYADYEEHEAFSMAIAALRQPEQKKSKWEKDGTYWDGIDEWHVWKCLKCTAKSYKKSPYCPNCGAKMEDLIARR